MNGAARRMVVAIAAALLASVHVDAKPAGLSEQELRLDLFRVITLEGLECGAIKSFERENRTDYLVHCENGKDYVVAVNDQKRVRVLDPETSQEAGDWSTPLRHVVNLMFSVLTLGGHDCDAVSRVQRLGTADHSVACRNGRHYRVDATDGGKLRVTPR